MTNDLFALFGEIPRPWIDGEGLKGKYLELAARCHPDVAGEEGGDFAEINRAYQTLSEPATRLRHLLELEWPEGVRRTEGVPEDVVALFAVVAEARQEVDEFLKKRAGAGSPIAKAMLSREQYAVQEKVEEAIGRLQEKQEGLVSRVREADGLWFTDREAALRLLPELWQSLGYVAKWAGLLRESLYELASLGD
jgi:curved DNA-binding protein CbpA